jgi:DNA-binding CsgD family transcriptional regulator
LKKYYDLQEKISGSEQKLKIEGINVKYSVAEKENKIKILSLKNKINSKKLFIMWLFIAVLVFMLLGLFLFYKLKQKQNKLDMLKMRKSIEEYISKIEETQEKNAELIKQNEERIINKVKKFDLTEREEEILLLISKGHTNKEIAEKMFVSVNTIKTHTKNIFIKLDVKNRTQAAKKAQNQ